MDSKKKREMGMEQKSEAPLNMARLKKSFSFLRICFLYQKEEAIQRIRPKVVAVATDLSEGTILELENLCGVSISQSCIY